MNLKAAFCLVFITILAFQLQAESVEDISINKNIQLVHLNDSVFIHVSWEKSEQYGRFPSNGLIIIKNGKAIMVDTPMDNYKTKVLVEYLQDSMHVKVVSFIAGHFHADCIGGLKYLHEIGVKSISNAMTIEKCQDLNLPVPQSSFINSLIFSFQDLQIECRYFGGGHSQDNITVWIPEYEILFGGCLIKSINANNLGNLEDAVVSDWDSTLLKILNQYTNIKFVIPGHGSFGGRELINHTLQLVEFEKKK